MLWEHMLTVQCFHSIFKFSQTFTSVSIKQLPVANQRILVELPVYLILIETQRTRFLFLLLIFFGKKDCLL